MDHKECFKCKEVKELSLFYAHKGMSDGHLGKCKDCTKSDALNHRKGNLDKIRAYDRERGKLEHRKKSRTEYTKRRRKTHPLSYKAHSLVYNAIRNGKLVRPETCSCCGTKKRILGHHHDYNKPLEVVWLCQICHKQLHKLPF